MSTCRYRLAKPCDAKQIANCHWHVRDRYTKGIFLSLGEKFLRSYYKIILNDPYEVVVCAEKDGRIIGFASTTLNAAAQAKNLKAHKWQLGIAALGAIICKPFLLHEVWQRYQSLDSDATTPSFVHTDGVRGEYWCWLKTEDDGSFASMELSNIKNRILYDLGVRELFFEVDKFNSHVYKYHLKVNKAIPVEEITLPDGRERVLMKKVLKY